MKQKYTWMLLFAIVICAFAVRSINTNHLPSGLFPDEAENGIDAITANSTGQYKLFYEANNGREGLFINLQAMSLKIFGDNIAALRLFSAIFGTLTVLGVFFFLYEIMKNYWIGIIGAYITAFSYWAINFSRIGFRANMVPFILVWSFYFIFKGLHTKKYKHFIIAGFIYGLGIHTYIAFRVSPLVLIMLFCALLIARKGFFKDYWKHTLLFTIAMFITALPMLLDFFVFHPEHYASRTSEISILNPENNQGHLFTLLIKTFGLSLAKYNFWGDQNMRQNYAPYPILNPIVGITFLIGFIYIFIQWFRLFWLRLSKKVFDERFVIYTFLLSWFFVLLIPEFLANEGNPQALRSIGTLPVVMIISAIPFDWILKKINSYGYSFKITSILSIIAIFIFIGIFDLTKYFVLFANNPKQHIAFNKSITDTAFYANNLSPEIKKYIVADEYTLRPIEFISHNTKNVFYTWPSHIEFIDTNTENFVILIPDENNNALMNIKKNFPNLKIYNHGKQADDLFIELKK